MSKWPVRPLGDAYWFQEGPGVRKWQFRGTGVKLLNVANITSEGNLDLSSTERYLAQEEVQEKYSHFLIDAGDMVIASSGISFDKDGLLRTRGVFVETQHLPLCLNTSTIRFKPEKGVSSLGWLRHWLESAEFRGQITRLVTGSAQQNFGPSHLRATTITLPPLAEQERIVKLLDEADGLRKLRAQADRRTADLIPALFHEMFGETAENLKGWPVKGLGDVLSVSPERADPANYPDRLFNYVGLESVEGDTGKLLPFQLTLGAEIKSIKNVFHPGEILFGRLRPYLNKVHLAVAHGICSTDIYVLRPQNGVIHPSYVACYLRSSYVLSAASGTVTGANLPRISRDALLAIHCPVPPIALQRYFGERIAEIRQIECAQATSRARLDALFQSMLHRAFNGEM